MAHPSKTHTAVAVLAFEVKPGVREIMLLPAGEFRTADGSGRPEEVAAWRLTAEIAARVIARAARSSKMVVDYEHQTLNAAKNGLPAPASGWIDRATLSWREGDGLYAQVEWTEKAAQMIAAGEYRYLSPVFAYDKRTGEVLALRHVALVNDPGLDMQAVALSAYSDFSTEEEPQMLEKLLAALGLSATAGEAEALSAIVSLKSQADSAAAKVAEIAALKSQAPDPAQYVAVATMHAIQAENTSLKAQLNDIEVSAVVTAALAAGQLLPAQKEWAEDLGKANLAALKSYVEKTPANPALAAMQTQGKAAVGEGIAALSAAELAICKNMGQDPVEFAKSLKAGS